MQSTGVLNLVIGLTGVTEKRGAHMSYISCPASSALTFSCRRPFSSRLRTTARLHSCRRRRSTPPARTHFTHRRASHHRAFFKPPLFPRSRRSLEPPSDAARACHRRHALLCISAPPP